MKSMNIYKPTSSEGFELCHPVDQEDFETIIVQIDGVHRADAWKPIQMNLIKDDEGRELRRSDSPWLGVHALIFRSASIFGLRKLLNDNGELLPLLCRNEKLQIYNPTNVLPALNEDQSEIYRFDDGGIMMIRKYVLHENVVSGVDIFKLKGLRGSPTFVSQRFVDAWTESGLVGLDFTPV